MKTILSLFLLLICMGCTRQHSPIVGVWSQINGVKYTTITEPGHESRYESEQTHSSVWYFGEDFQGYYKMVGREKVPFSYKVDGRNITVSPKGIDWAVWRGSIELDRPHIHMYRNQITTIDNWSWSTTYDLELSSNYGEQELEIFLEDAEEGFER